MSTDLHEPGVVSVVLVNYKGAPDTITALQGVADLDYPAGQVQAIVVDNASGDGSAQAIRAAVPTAVVIESTTNSGFAGGCNLGVAHARGEYVAFLNNDARPHPAWLSAAVEVLAAEPDVACVASKVLDWEGQTVDYVNGALTWFGMGYKLEVGLHDTGQFDRAKDVLFATGSAMIMRRSVFEKVGGFDERFFMFYEDVDLGWRLNLLGYRVRYEPTSVAYHRHHASMARYGAYRETYLHERNALISMYKNYEDETLARTLPAAMMLAVRRSVAGSDFDARLLDLQTRPGGDDEASVSVPKAVLAGPMAIDYLVEQFPQLAADRADLQARRRRSDADLLPLFGDSLEPAYGYEGYRDAHDALVEAFGVEELVASRRRIAVVTGEPLSGTLAGPAIRALEMARLLAREHEVQLVTMGTASITDPDVTIRAAGRREMHQVVDWADVVIFQGLLLSMHPWIAQTATVLVADVYDPFHLEVLEQYRSRDEAFRTRTSEDTVDALNRQLARADFVLCASPKQRDFWLGQLAGLGRINPFTYDDDESLDRLIAVAPFGLPAAPPRRTGPALRGVVPGIEDGDDVVLWGGGVYNWFDPLTLVRAVDALRERLPRLRLVFLGMRHPNPGVPQMEMAVRVRALADELGLTDRHVFFTSAWVPYDERGNYLLDASVGVSCHFPHVETAFSFRTRILDYLWAGLPVVCTEGDSFADLITAQGVGIAVPPEDVTALANALERVLTEPDFAARCSEHSRDLARQFTWERSLAPLVEFCRQPARAADLAHTIGPAEFRPPMARQLRRPSALRDDWELARKYLSEGGVGEVGTRAWGRLRRQLGRTG